MTQLLQGPADPEAFRVKVGWNRYYTDPLPACDIAPASEATFPSISKVKKAEGQDWSFVSLRRIANASDNDYATLARLPKQRRYDALNSIQKYGLSVDAGRGTIVHLWGEDLLHGREMRDITLSDLAELDVPPAARDIAERYKPALLDFFESYQPRLIATEFVVIDRSLNGLGYGGTPDGLWMLDKPPAGKSEGPWAFDYKSRGPTSSHGAYPDEAAQIAAGVRGEYMVVSDGNGDAVRTRIPEVAGGMVVSIKPDGARIYPVDIDDAYGQWVSRHRRFAEKETEPSGIQRVWPVRRAS